MRSRRKFRSCRAGRQWTLALVCTLAGACGFSASSESLGGDDDPFQGDSALDCGVAEDCVLVASSCCSCPTFASPLGAGFDEVCEEVECPTAPECAPSAAACVEGRCALICVPIETELICANGFAVDDLGCTLEECVTDLTPECADAGDCVQVPADCCGCEEGGRDTAIPLGSETEHLNELACMGPISCPGVDTCEADATVACLGGTCRFFGQPEGNLDAPPELCGTTETAPCAAGEVCVLNHPDASDSGITGVGICQPAP